MISGIDISHYTNITQSIINSITKSKGLYFVFVKSSTGASGKDPRFAQNWQLCRTTGLLCGAYHWLWPLSDPSKQANNLVSQYMQVSRAGVLPPAIDIEWTYNANDTQRKNELWSTITPAQRIFLIQEFLQNVEAQLNVKPIIYTAFNFWDSLISLKETVDTSFFADYPLWIADPNNNKKIPAAWANSKAAFTQNHFGETYKGTDPYELMDHDIFNSSLKDLLNTAAPGFIFMKGFPYSQMVKDMQQQLSDKQFLTDTPDGLFGKNTANAVTTFQTSNGLIGNGIIDARTWNKLLA